CDTHQLSQRSLPLRPACRPDRLPARHRRPMSSLLKDEDPGSRMLYDDHKLKDYEKLAEDSFKAELDETVKLESDKILSGVKSEDALLYQPATTSAAGSVVSVSHGVSLSAVVAHNPASSSSSSAGTVRLLSTLGSTTDTITRHFSIPKGESHLLTHHPEERGKNTTLEAISCLVLTKNIIQREINIHLADLKLFFNNHSCGVNTSTKMRSKDTKYPEKQMS
ncbi:Uncharacterized protein FKW44_012706, partial [Caligus rogercresseyi]